VSVSKILSSLGPTAKCRQLELVLRVAAAAAFVLAILIAVNGAVVLAAILAVAAVAVGFGSAFVGGRSRE